MPERIIPFLKSALVALPILTMAGLAPVRAQPTPAPASGDLPCKEEADVVGIDTVASGGGVDKEGYFPLFDGTFKGWFQSCLTEHSEGSTQGGIFRIGQADGKPALYTARRGSSTGGLMMTNKKFTNYEITFETWPDFGNDAGLFNRTNMKGRCFQTVLDYIGGASVGGSWGEGGFPGRDYRPFSYNGSELDLTIPGGPNGELSNWTIITQKLKATTEPNLPCPSSGCSQAEWRQLWDMDGWNQIKVQFYGGHAAGTGNLHMKTWFKKPSASIWVPIIQDTIAELVAPPGYIGIQIHRGGRWSGQKGTWYRNIKWKPLTDKGVAVPQVPKPDTATGIRGAGPRFRFTANSDAIVGSIDRDYRIEVADAAGHRLESFTGKAGAVHHAFAGSVRGLILVRVSSAGSSETIRLIRPLK